VEEVTMKRKTFLFHGRFLCYGFIFCMILAGSAVAQMSMVSSYPADGDVSVPTLVTFHLTFSQPIDDTVEFDEFFLSLEMFPLNEGGGDVLTFSPDKKTVYFHDLQLLSDTKYLVLLMGAKSTTGVSLDKPYVITFTTGSSLPTNTVSGTVSFPGGDPTNTFVGLLEMGEDGPEYFAGTVVQASNGAYTIPYVEAGDYFIGAIKDSDGDGNLDPPTGDAFNFYDPDEDGFMDLITVAGNVTGIDIEIGVPVPQTAQALTDQAVTMAQAMAADVELILILGEGLDPNGASMFWMYGCYSGSEQKIYYFFSIGTLILFMGEADVAVEIEPLPDVWIDSDEALAIAESNGGTDFRAAYQDWEIDAIAISDAGLGILSEDAEGFPGDGFKFQQPSYQLLKGLYTTHEKYVWIITYSSDSADEWLDILIDAETGDLITGVDSERLYEDVPISFELHQNYPNPFNPETSIQFNVPQKELIQLRILDLMGREVTMLLDKTLSPGSYKVDWNGTDAIGKKVGSGLYLYEIRAGSFKQVRRMLLLK
jgi:methionine-rich copper-binding protein CopC